MSLRSPSSNGFTPTEKRLLQILRDGLSHAAEDLIECLYDPLGKVTNLAPHMTYLRRKLRPQHTIVHERMDGRSYYRLVRRIADDS